MIYNFTGQFSAAIAAGFIEPLANVKVRLYRYRETQFITSLSVKDPAETLRVLTEHEVDAKRTSLIAEAVADAEGHFSIEIGEDDGYGGEAFEIHLFIDNIVGRRSKQPFRSCEIYLATMKPRWMPSETKDEQQASWSYTLPEDFWCNLRRSNDAWVIVGRVRERNTEMPLRHLHVTAFDEDWIQDDNLGSAITNEEGWFRIDYSSEDFTQTPLSPLVNTEDAGPDLYFNVKTASGEPWLIEPRELGHDKGRLDVDACCYVDLLVEREELLA